MDKAELDDSIMNEDGKIYHYKENEIVGITVTNASKISKQNKAAKAEPSVSY